jgi:hypothetical protein
MNANTYYAAAGALAMFDLGMFFLKLLAIAGGAVLGGAGAGAAVKRVSKMTIRKEAPRAMVLPSRVGGGVAAGLGVWLWAFGAGGSGLGVGSGGLGGGGGRFLGYDPAPEEPAKEHTGQTERKQDGPPGASGVTARRSARIEMLGGSRVQRERFYVIDEQPPAHTIDEVRQILLARRNQENDPIKAIEIVIYEDSVAKDHPAVRELEQWANQNGLPVTLSFPQGVRPLN